ncbi:hypothetical protein Mpet_2161 [Methanolacinia petrolearia DSM 11571]|uniref:DUF3821 domain-containing protein n=1 Tax=Methanolacinia petrolearia (strain DSM 11571 / OCM 486 / SEBR 4847) TaxID=679926 RepID=E1RK96_METP4|nr:hypothetical protein [Methanolacinia petrolearia]ADN36909.1 hypothetical protein Mpet_2161 [Methanolacinia petrolearia DSM 11571]
MNSKLLSILIISVSVFYVVCPAWAGGQVTITAQGDSRCFIGEKITFSGTNTDSDYTYLFITGAYLDPDGDKLSDPDTKAVTGNGGTFARAAVTGDSWKYTLDTRGLDLEAGAYTVYAVSEPKNKEDLSSGIYDTASIVIRKPFAEVKVSDTDIRAGEKLTISGTAYGEPGTLGIWVFGPGYWNGAGTGSMVTESPDADGSYRYVIEGEETSKMDGGEYYVLVQHPMYNDQLDLITKPGSGDDTIIVSERESSDPVFVVWGSSAISGVDALKALTRGLQSSNIDDSYEQCSFKVEGMTENVQSQTEEKTEKYQTEEKEQPQNVDNPEDDQPEKSSGNSIFSALADFLSGIFR